MQGRSQSSEAVSPLDNYMLKVKEPVDKEGQNL